MDRLSRASFDAAVAAYAFPELEFDPAALAAARRTLAETGLLVLGEQHGVHETPAAVYALARTLGIRAVAFEWSHDELEPLDLDRLWTLPPTSEFFCGDGRITAGHFALLERLQPAQVICFDRLDPEPPSAWADRDREMAERLLAEWDRSLPLLVVTGAFHAQLEAADGEPMAAHLARALPGLQPAMLAFAGTEMPPAPIVFELPAATPAVTPAAPAA